MGERHIQSRSEYDVILLLSCRGIGDINVAERVLPAQPLADLGHGSEIEGSAILAGIAQIRIKIQLLRDQRPGANFM